MNLIKSQKTIANTLKLHGKPKRKKDQEEEERTSTMSMAITGRILLCARVLNSKDSPASYWKRSTIYTGNVYLDKVVESSST